MGNAKYIGRVGALAVALGVGIAVASSPGVALAEPADSSTSSSPMRRRRVRCGARARRRRTRRHPRSSTSTDLRPSSGSTKCARPDGPEQFRRPHVVANRLHPGRSRAGGGGRADCVRARLVSWSRGVARTPVPRRSHRPRLQRRLPTPNRPRRLRRRRRAPPRHPKPPAVTHCTPLGQTPLPVGYHCFDRAQTAHTAAPAAALRCQEPLSLRAQRPRPPPAPRHRRQVLTSPQWLLMSRGHWP